MGRQAITASLRDEGGCEDAIGWGTKVAGVSEVLATRVVDAAVGMQQDNAACTYG